MTLITIGLTISGIFVLCFMNVALTRIIEENYGTKVMFVYLGMAISLCIAALVFLIYNS